MLDPDLLNENLPDKKKGRKDVFADYDSDSENNLSDSDDSVSESPKEPEKEDTKDGDESDDMFESDKEEAVEQPAKSKLKLLDMEQFEKEQELEVADAEPQTEQLDDEEKQRMLDFYNNIEDYDAERPRVKHEVQIEAFNLREETESGKFDKDMNYVREKDSDSEKDEDAWMGDLKKADIEKAKKAQEAQRRKQDQALQSKSLEELLQQLIPLLEPAETPLEALSRLRPNKKKKKVQEDGARKQNVYDITESCEALSTHNGVVLVYDMSREELMRLFKQETGSDYSARGTKRSAEELEDDEEKIWEFRWIDDAAVNGPYSTYEMAYWKQNYFENNVEVRRAGDNTFEHVSLVDFE